MPFQLILPWFIMLPMIFGASLVSVYLFLAFLVAAIGLSATHAYHMVCAANKDDAAEA